MVDLILAILAICIWGLLIGLTIAALMDIVKYLRKIAQFMSTIARALSTARFIIIPVDNDKIEVKQDDDNNT